MKIPNYESYGAKMKTLIHKCVGIPICVGFAPSKALAKVANKIAKKFPDRTQGVYVIDT
jgi:DNA polymerase V